MCPQHPPGSQGVRVQPHLSCGAVPGATGVWGLPPIPHTRTGYVGGLEALELFILLKPCYKQQPQEIFILIAVLRGCLSGG